MPEATLQDLVAELAATRHAGGYRFKVPERVLRQFAGYCRRQGYPDGSITQQAAGGFLYGRHLRASTIRRNELALRQLAGHARAAGWQAFTPAAATQVRVRHQPPYVFTDDEVRRLFAAIDSQPMSAFPDKAMAGPVLFRVLYGAGLRISEALHLTPADADTSSGILRIRASKNGQSRTVPVIARLTATLAGYITAAHPAPGTSDYVFYSVAPESFCRYTAAGQPDQLGRVTQVLAIRQKKIPAPRLDHLTGDEVKTLLAEPGTASPRAVRDTVLLALAYDTAARVQELCDLDVADIRRSSPMTVVIHGKGSKIRYVPVMDPTARLASGYLDHATAIPAPAPTRCSPGRTTPG